MAEAKIGAGRVIPGLSWEAEPVPEPLDAFRPALVGGMVGWGVAIFMGARSPSQLLLTCLGAAAGAIAARYRVRLEWDPESPRIARTSTPRPASNPRIVAEESSAAAEPSSAAAEPTSTSSSQDAEESE
ncbi:MAG: hypothetical protein JKY65_30235 [Planctomycetes bacterium]|nr:hypothetical protein [Planctomycetota bacterium]